MEIAAGVHSMSQSTGGHVHAFLLDDGEDLTLIDTLFDTDAGRVLDRISAIGKSVQDLKNIVLTHAHRSHLGGLAALKDLSGATVYSHAWEADIVAGERTAQPISPIPMRPLHTYWRVYYLQFGAALGRGKHPPCPVDATLEDGDTVGPVRVLHTGPHARPPRLLVARAEGSHSRRRHSHLPGVRAGLAGLHPQPDATSRFLEPHGRARPGSPRGRARGPDNGGRRRTPAHFSRGFIGSRPRCTFPVREHAESVYTDPMRPICFISDYGLPGELVGICKGVMMSVAPSVSIIDVSHSVPVFDVVRGAETLRHATSYMPDDAVYLAVIDPYDKPARRELAAETDSGAYLVGPDNGLLLPAAEALGGVARAVLLTNPEYHLHPVSKSFHGRDIFSPVAAHLAAGAGLGDLGEDVTPASLSPIDFPEARKEGDGLAAEIIDIDSFGNARLSATPGDLDLGYGAHVEVSVRDETMDATYVQTFGSSEDGDLVLLTDSHWRLSLAVNRGNAANALLLSVGDEVRIQRVEEGSSFS